MAITTSSAFQIFNVTAASLPTTGLKAGALYFWKNGIYLCEDGLELTMLGQFSSASVLPSAGVAGRFYVNTTDGTINYWVSSLNEGAGGWAQLNANKATQLATGRAITISGGATGAAENSAVFDGTAAYDIVISSLDASKLSGTIPASVVVSTGENSSSAVATESYVTSAINTAVTSVMHYRGTIATTAALPTADMIKGDVYNISADGTNWAYSEGSTKPGGDAREGVDYIAVEDADENVVGYWEKLGATLDLSNYVTLDGTQTITGAKTLTGAVAINGGSAASGDNDEVNKEFNIGQYVKTSFSGDVSINGTASDKAAIVIGSDTTTTNAGSVQMSGTVALNGGAAGVGEADPTYESFTIGQYVNTVFSGDVKVPTAAATSNDTTAASTAFVTTAISNATLNWQIIS